MEGKREREEEEERRTECGQTRLRWRKEQSSFVKVPTPHSQSDWQCFFAVSGNGISAS